MTWRKVVAVAILLSFVPSVAGGAEAQAGKTRLLMNPSIAWTRVSLLDNVAAIKALLDAADPAAPAPTALFVLPGKDLDATVKDEAFVALVARIQALKAPIVGVNAAFEKLKAAGVDCVAEAVAQEGYAACVRLIVKREQQSGQTACAPAESPPATAVITLGQGFDDHQCAALRAFLEWRGQTMAMAGPKVGWMRGKEGCPV
jgi:hypothetical protein